MADEDHAVGIYGFAYPVVGELTPQRQLCRYCYEKEKHERTSPGGLVIETRSHLSNSQLPSHSIHTNEGGPDRVTRRSFSPRGWLEGKSHHARAHFVCNRVQVSGPKGSGQ